MREGGRLLQQLVLVMKPLLARFNLVDAVIILWKFVVEMLILLLKTIPGLLMNLTESQETDITGHGTCRNNASDRLWATPSILDEFKEQNK
jgi:hypothetical protein